MNYSRGQNGNNFNDGSQVECDWRIRATGTQQGIELQFLEFDTRRSTDYLSIYDGSSASSSDQIGASLSGSMIPSNLFSTNQYMYMRWRSGNSYMGSKGFKVKVKTYGKYFLRYMLLCAIMKIKME